MQDTVLTGLDWDALVVAHSPLAERVRADVQILGPERIAWFTAYFRNYNADPKNSPGRNMISTNFWST